MKAQLSIEFGLIALILSVYFINFVYPAVDNFYRYATDSVRLVMAKKAVDEVSQCIGLATTVPKDNAQYANILLPSGTTMRFQGNKIVVEIKSLRSSLPIKSFSNGSDSISCVAHNKYLDCNYTKVINATAFGHKFSGSKQVKCVNYGDHIVIK